MIKLYPHYALFDVTAWVIQLCRSEGHSQSHKTQATGCGLIQFWKFHFYFFFFLSKGQISNYKGKGFYSECKYFHYSLVSPISLLFVLYEQLSMHCMELLQFFVNRCQDYWRRKIFTLSRNVKELKKKKFWYSEFNSDRHIIFSHNLNSNTLKHSQLKNKNAEP